MNKKQVACIFASIAFISTGTYANENLQCYADALKVGANQKSLLTPLERSFVHPGIYTSSSQGLEGLTHIAKTNKLLARYLAPNQNSNQELVRFTSAFHHLLGSYNLDGDIMTENKWEQKLHEKALSILSPFLDKPVDNWEPKSIITKIQQAAKILGDLEEFGKANTNTSFRNSEVLIRRGHGAKGVFYYISAMKEQLKGNKAHLNHYLSLIPKVKTLAEKDGIKVTSLPDGKEFRSYWENVIALTLFHSKTTPLGEFVNQHYQLIDSTPKQISTQMVSYIQEIKRVFLKEQNPLRAAAYAHQEFM